MEFKTVTVIGANGVMGRNVSAIFASFGKAKVYMVSRDIEKAKKACEKAYLSVRAESVKRNMIPADYSMLELCVRESDIVFESISENWVVKENITNQIATIALKYMTECENTVFCTGSSGLSITSLAEIFPEQLRGNYMGMHMFNPPYTMTLCELIGTTYSSQALFKAVKDYCRDVLLRTVVEVKDAPAFLGNRIGFQFINEAMQYAEKYKDNGGVDYIDSILGPFTGRSMAPLVTANFVGLDVHKAIVDNLYANTNDFAHETFKLPSFVQKLVSEGNLGRKSGVGLYKTKIHDDGKKAHYVYDVALGEYREVVKYTYPFVEFMIKSIREGDYHTAFDVLKQNHSLEADICWHFLLKYVVYSMVTVDEVGYDMNAADDVMATGFNWCPPYALLEAIGGKEEFLRLCDEKLDSADTENVELNKYLEKFEGSRYDFRKYLKAKK